MVDGARLLAGGGRAVQWVLTPLKITPISFRTKARLVLLRPYYFSLFSGTYARALHAASNSPPDGGRELLMDIENALDKTPYKKKSHSTHSMHACHSTPAHSM